MNKLLQERWMRLAFAPNSTTVRIDEADEDLQETENNLWNNIRKAQEKPKSQRNHPNSKEYQSAKKAAKEINNESDETLEETDENPFMAKIAHAAVDGEDTVIIGDKEYDVDMDPETAEEITGEKIQEAIANWYHIINEDGFDKEKKDKMKCNSPRRLRSGEPGHGDKSKVVKACDPGSDDEKIVKFGDPDMPVQSHHADNKASFRARHSCDDKTMKGDWDAAGYWSCKEW